MRPFAPPEWMTDNERQRFHELHPSRAPEDPAALRAVAVVNAGRWIAQCPRRYCYNAVRLEPGQRTFHCAAIDGCQLIAPVIWPPNAQEIWDELSRRPAPSTRNWAPAGHPQAISTGFPDGQTVRQLRVEANEHMSEEG